MNLVLIISSEKIKDHNGKDTFFYIFTNGVPSDQPFVSCDDLRIVGRNYRNNTKTKNRNQKL